MRIVIAMDSFKGSLSAEVSCRAVAEGLRQGMAQVSTVCYPMADGGEGTVACMVSGGRGKTLCRTVFGPFGDLIKADFGILDDGKTGVVETASASGIAGLRPEILDPQQATTYGTGQLILSALEAGCRRVIVGLGGSATNDGGMGALQALGIRFYAEDGTLLGWGGREMERVAHIDCSRRNALLEEAELLLACDVTNPFFGPEGAAFVFAPQKGASPQMTERLDLGLRNLAFRYREAFGTDVSELPGSGAAGGLCGGLVAGCGGIIYGGFDIIAETVGLVSAVSDCDFVITGEGKTDGQTRFGKLPYRVGELAARSGVPCICVSGGVVPEAANLYACGVTCLFDTTLLPMSVSDAMDRGEASLRFVSQNIGRLLSVQKK